MSIKIYRLTELPSGFCEPACSVLKDKVPMTENGILGNADIFGLRTPINEAARVLAPASATEIISICHV